MLEALEKEIEQAKNTTKAQILQKFFKTGPGQYAEGDIFWGIIVPKQREIAKNYATKITIDEAEKLLQSPIHEKRLIALLIWQEQFKKGTEEEKRNIFGKYLQNTSQINNWDLVDISAPNIIGVFLENQDKEIIYQMAHSKILWVKRIAIVSTFAWIKKGNISDTQKICEILQTDKQDLIHKACGWMLRECAKKKQTTNTKIYKKKRNKNATNNVALRH